jgi:hypothetical protein
MKITPTPETIWKRPAFLPYVHPTLTDDALGAVETQFGVTLPDDFVSLLRVQNGGPIRFTLPNAVGELIAGIGQSFPSLTHYELADNQEYVDFSLDGLVPFDGDGHWYNCLDFRNNKKNPEVAFIDVECNTQRRIGSSFANFLTQLELALETEMVVRNVVDIEDARAQLETVFGASFERSVSNVGVPYWMCKTGTETNACFWLISNTVARGYSGRNPDSFQFEGEALLFPELTHDAVIFEAPETRMESYAEQLGEAGLELMGIEDAAKAT